MLKPRPKKICQCKKPVPKEEVIAAEQGGTWHIACGAWIIPPAAPPDTNEKKK